MGYNHDDIMVWQEASIAEKIIKLFPNENIVFNEKSNTRKPGFWFKNHNLTIEVDEENHEIMAQTMKKKEKTCLKVINLKHFDLIQMIITLIFLNL